MRTAVAMAMATALLVAHLGQWTSAYVFKGVTLVVCMWDIARATEQSAYVGDAAGGAERRAGDADDDSDIAPFTMVVEHDDGWRCFGSLVSLRTAVTSAWCARGRAVRPELELWVRPVHAARKARRVARVALVASSEAAEEGPDAAVAGDPWLGAAEDLAVLELEEPFGDEARARPILMATDVEECAPSGSCHALHAVPGRSGRVALRVVDVAVVGGEECAARGPRWPSLRSSVLCLVGSSLCAGDWGAGVVCAGKLCGVVSRSAGEGGEAGCGDTHVAQALPRWRRFLHCAHTLRACGTDGECAQLCVERRLTREEAAPTVATHVAVVRDSSPLRTKALIRETIAESKGTRRLVKTTQRLGLTPTRSSTPAMATLARSPSTILTRPSFEFEPNRPDFKAGEYGDNGAEYGGMESAGPVPTRTSAAACTVHPEARQVGHAAWQRLSASDATSAGPARSSAYSSLRPSWLAIAAIPIVSS